MRGFVIIESRYASRNLIDESGILNSVMNLRLNKGQDIGDHVALMEAKFTELAAIEDVVSKSMKVAMLISSFLYRRKYRAVLVLINNMKTREAVWEYVTMIFIKEQQTLKPRRSRIVTMPNFHEIMVAALSRRSNRMKNGGFSKEIKCFKCGKRAHCKKLYTGE